jgi:hypothetical protein
MLLVVGILTSSPFALNPYPWSRARSVRNNKEWNNKVSQATSSFTSSRFADPRGPTEEVEGSAKVA